MKIVASEKKKEMKKLQHLEMVEETKEELLPAG